MRKQLESKDSANASGVGMAHHPLERCPHHGRRAGAVFAWRPPGKKNQQMQGLGQHIAFTYESRIWVYSSYDIVDEFINRIRFHIALST
jgi:hypothetical protein